MRLHTTMTKGTMFDQLFKSVVHKHKTVFHSKPYTY